MIFQSITLHNLFSYRGQVHFDLARTADTAGNIVVILGRNGQGKTSFLNSVKLLFGGVTEELRKAVLVQRDRPLQEKGFVLGDRDWWGILNHQARVAGEMRCSVSAVLLNEKGQEIQVARSWDLANGNYKNRLKITAPRKPPLEDEQAQQYLSQLLPRDYIPFFFFDAEELGYLAEANRSQTIEKMELLLNIRPADNLRDALNDIRREWGRQALDDQAQLELKRAENRRDELQMQMQAWRQEETEISGEIDRIEDDLRQAEQAIRLLRGTGSLESSARLEAEKNKEKQQLEAALAELSAAFEQDAFLRLNAPLAQQAYLAAQSCAADQRNATSELLLSLKDQLKNIFTTPPYPAYPESRLSEAQARFYQQRIFKQLDANDVSQDTQNLFHLDTGQAYRLANQLAAYQPRSQPDAAMRSAVERALNAEQAYNAADSELQNVRQLSDDDRLRLEQMERDRSDLESRRRDKQDRLRTIQKDLDNAQRDISRQENQIDDLQKKAESASQMRGRVNLLDKMLGLLAAYKQQVKTQKRAVLEEAFNRHLGQLLDSNALIAEARIDQDFLLSYHDAAGNEVPMSSLSAGMKQLAATALLWALKDASARRLPVIVDTPLGRIDRRHQENLLHRYYPQAGEQVILLPTDSELDEVKRKILQPHIYREYHLRNPSGEATQLDSVQGRS